MHLSDYLENQLCNAILGGGTWTRPATIYIALFTSGPNDAGAGTEVSGGSYARAIVTNNTTNFPNAAGGTKTNATEIAFPTATADWGAITGMAVFDAASGGNCLLAFQFSTTRSILNGDTAKFAPGSISLSFN
jgi:hypothetical protein